MCTEFLDSALGRGSLKACDCSSGHRFSGQDEIDGTDSGSCPMAGFDRRGAELPDLVASLFGISR